jgi:hypothetical protein
VGWPLAAAEAQGRGLCSKVNRRRNRFQSMDSIMVPNEVSVLEDTLTGSSNAEEVKKFMKNVLQSH